MAGADILVEGGPGEMSPALELVLLLALVGVPLSSMSNSAHSHEMRYLECRRELLVCELCMRVLLLVLLDLRVERQ